MNMLASQKVSDDLILTFEASTFMAKNWHISYYTSEILTLILVLRYLLVFQDRTCIGQTKGQKDDSQMDRKDP